MRHSMATIDDGCVCGAVRYTIRTEGIVLFNTCYCERCQKNSGSAYTAQLQVEPNAFSWVQGEVDIARFESSPGIFRSFCPTCGSRVPQLNPTGVFAVPAGTLDDDPGVTPEFNIYTERKRGWATIDQSIDSLPQQGSAEFWQEFMRRKGGA